MNDYERGVEQASDIYKEVIREYVAENTKLRELVRDLYLQLLTAYDPKELDEFINRMSELWYPMVEPDGFCAWGERRDG